MVEAMRRALRSKGSVGKSVEEVVELYNLL